MEKVRVELVNGDLRTITKGQYDDKTGFIFVQSWVGFKRTTSPYLVVTPRHFTLHREHNKTLRSISLDSVSSSSINPVDISPGATPNAQETKTAVELLGKQKLWNSIGGRPLDRMETIIYLLAGYGLLRWAEITLIRIFAPSVAVVPP